MKYIDKTVVVAELENIETDAINQYKIDKSRYAEGSLDVIHRIKHLLDTLEIKEVDLEKELKDFLEQYYNYDYPKQYQEGTGSNVMPHIVETAKYFFNLGLKTQQNSKVEQ